MNPRQFEELVCEHFRNKGYEIQLTAFTGDYGVDVFASKNASGASFRLDLLKPLFVILRILNCSFPVSQKKLFISLCNPVFPILNMLIIKSPKGNRRLLVKAPSWLCV